MHISTLRHCAATLALVALLVGPLALVMAQQAPPAPPTIPSPTNPTPPAPPIPPTALPPVQVAPTGQATARNEAYLGVVAEPREDQQDGVWIRNVAPESPAAQAGLRRGDRIVKADDKTIKNFEDLRNVVAGHLPGDRLAIRYMRDDKEDSANVTLATLPAGTEFPQPETRARAFLGVQTQPLTTDLRDRLGVSVEKGALVTSVLPGSPAAQAGIREEDVITQLGDSTIANPEDLRQAVEKFGSGKETTVHVARGKQTLDFKVRLGEAPMGPGGPGAFFSGLPEGFEQFRGRLPGIFTEAEKVPALEKRIEELEKRIREIEQKQNK